MHYLNEFFKKQSKEQTNINISDSMNIVPVNTWEEIFQTLSLKDLTSASKVCKKWNKIIMESTETVPSFFDRVDNHRALYWLKKIEEELTKFPPAYDKRKTQQYSNFYNTMNKKSTGSISKYLISPSASFDEQVDFYLDRGLDVGLQKYLESIEEVSSRLDNYLSLNKIHKLFGLNNIHCLSLIVSYLTPRGRGILLHMAVERRHEEYVKDLLKFEVNLSIYHPDRDDTTLAVAKKNGDAQILTMLCEKIFTQDFSSLDAKIPNFREIFYYRYRISYQFFLNFLPEEKKQERKLSEIKDKTDAIFKQLSIDKDLKLISLFHEIIQSKDDVLLEKLSAVVKDHNLQDASKQMSFGP